EGFLAGAFGGQHGHACSSRLGRRSRASSAAFVAATDSSSDWTASPCARAARSRAKSTACCKALVSAENFSGSIPAILHSLCADGRMGQCPAGRQPRFHVVDVLRLVGVLAHVGGPLLIL